MTPAAEATIRRALVELGDALIAAFDAETDRAEQLLTIPAAAERLGGLARSTVYRLIADGEIRTIKVGGRRLVPASAIAELATGGTR